jgi:hypothetical protein
MTALGPEADIRIYDSSLRRQNFQPRLLTLSAVFDPSGVTSLRNVLLMAATERIEIDPDTLECSIHYRIGWEGRNKVASPRGRAAIPAFRAVRKFLAA